MGLSLKRIGKRIEDVASGVVNQINPLDQGRTFSHPNVVAPPQGQPIPIPNALQKYYSQYYKAQ